MNDSEIIALYFSRDEQAISETALKYGAYCSAVAMNILSSEQDSQECVNDTWLRAWNSIPPNRPQKLSAYLAKITRNLSLDAYKARFAEKRGQGEFALSLDELDDFLPDTQVEEDEGEIAASINRFLRLQKETARRVFVCRYFYCDSVSEIAVRFRLGESRVKSMLFRTREKLREHLKKEGIGL